MIALTFCSCPSTACVPFLRSRLASGSSLQAWSSIMLTFEDIIHGSSIGRAVNIGDCHAWVFKCCRGSSCAIRGCVFIPSARRLDFIGCFGASWSSSSATHFLGSFGASGHLTSPLHIPSGSERVCVVDILSTLPRPANLRLVHPTDSLAGPLHASSSLCFTNLVEHSS